MISSPAWQGAEAIAHSLFIGTQPKITVGRSHAASTNSSSLALGNNERTGSVPSGGYKAEPSRDGSQTEQDGAPTFAEVVDDDEWLEGVV